MTTPATNADATLRTPPALPGSSVSALELEAPILLKLQTTSPSLKIYTPSHPSFKIINTYFNLSLTAHPLAITRPTNTLQISQILSFTSTHSIPFTVRSGGHDSYGRSAISGSLIIDVRELDEIVLSSDQTSVRIGGGVISENLTKFLAPHGLVAVQGGCSSVGYTNWAACGGYGTLNGRFGMGCDQIIGARVVNYNGDVVDADEEMLWGLRGGGCAFGAVVSLDIKVYRLQKMLAGLLAFPIAEAREVLSSYRDLLGKVCPDAYGGLMGLMAIPGVGKVLMFMFTWASEDLEAGSAFLGELRNLGKVVMDTVKETTLASWTEVGKAFSPTFIYTNIRTAYVKELSEPFIDLLLKHVDKIPAGTKAMFIVHVVHGHATKPTPNSCFGMREPHVWVGIHGQTLAEENKQEAFSWADEVVEELTEGGLLMKGGYVALMGENEPTEDCFGDNWGRLKELKNKLDPNLFFRNTVPSLA
ncbi:FAD-binding domain-containing protein [Hyaloscypha variabilis F]|uniref:FAD-binding domain-containing protein n=1 Tax=Hyaloscypha variabilis (strain UAMH 11265 / GT02V1 / F) TaxID=1149755 RepID=A0A2J6RDJ6_HYAVF|nr:FAD-binding domain-containing protein [Hyaloscypha variabilis F]